MNNFISELKLSAKKIIFAFQRSVKKEFIEFHHFPFNTLDVRLKDQDVEELKTVTDVLQKTGVTYRLCGGTALGFYRDHQFIRHDNDFDLDLLDFSDVKCLKEIMKNYGYKIGRLVYYKGELQQIVFFNRDRVIMDFIVWHLNGDIIYNYSERGYKRIQKSRHFTKLTDCDCYNYTFKIPGDIEEWLVMRYGEDWKTPKTYKGDWKEECGDLQKM